MSTIHPTPTEPKKILYVKIAKTLNLILFIHVFVLTNSILDQVCFVELFFTGSPIHLL
jgi:hypothetical protein